MCSSIPSRGLGPAARSAFRAFAGARVRSARRQPRQPASLDEPNPDRGPGRPIAGIEFEHLRLAVRQRRPASFMARRPLIVRVIQPTWTLLNELALNIRTTPPAQSSATESTSGPQSNPLPRHNDSARYEVPDYFYMRKVLQVLSPGPEDVVFDLGCGLGRFLCLAARRNIRKCVGVELRAQFCEVAQENAVRLRGRHAPLEIRCGDAAAADLSGGTIYYMFNPFGPTTMRDVLANLHASISANPRTIKIAYYNSIHEELFQASPWLEKYHSFQVKSGMPVTFWRSRPGVPPLGD